MGIMERFSLSGKIAVVTGGSRGLGRSMALGLAEAGAKVVVVSRTKKLIEETATQIVKNGGEAIAIPTDVVNAEEIKRMTEAVMAKYGRIDILINNAGAGGSSASVDLTTEAWDYMMDTNAKSIFLVCREVGKIMIGQKSGRVINVASIMGECPLPEVLHYGASKAAVINMTKTLAKEWARHGISVNCIAPGWFTTEMTKEQQQGENQRFLLKKIPFKRFGEPEEIVGLTVFLSSAASNYMTGATIFIDGGYSIS